MSSEKSHRLQTLVFENWKKVEKLIWLARLISRLDKFDGQRILTDVILWIFIASFQFVHREI
jgi:hypothetical protein